MVRGVVADLIALGEDLAHQAGVAADLLPELEEGPVDVLSAQHPEEAGGVGAGAIVEGQGDDLLTTRAVADQARVCRRCSRSRAPAAAGRRRRARPGTGRRRGPGRCTRSPSIARQRYRLRSQPRCTGDQGDDQLAGAWALHLRRQGRGADHRPGAVEPGEPDPVPVSPRPAEAEPPLMVAGGPPQHHAEVARLRLREVGEAAEVLQRNRSRGADAEDHAATRLLEAGMGKISARRARRDCRGEGACAAQREGGNAKDLARPIH